MTILQYMSNSSYLQFDVPFDSIEARFIMAFERDVSDREFVLTVKNGDAEPGANSTIVGFSYSNTLKRDFVYVPKLAAGVEFQTKLFKVPMPCGRLYAEVLPWSDRSVAVEKALRGLAIELSTTDLGVPVGWGRLVLPGKEVRVDPS